MPTLGQALLLDVALAFVSHHAWYRRYEPKSLSAVLLATSLVTVPVTAISSLSPFVSLFGALLLANGVYALSLVLSVLIYRLSPFHPLTSVPGPLLCKASKLWTAYVAYRGDIHRYYKRLHDEYGLIVRVGPNEISVIDKSLIPSILGANGMPKGPVWDSRRIVTFRDTKDHRSLHAVRDLKTHAELRKPWNKAFGKEPMSDYQELLVARASQFLGHLKKLCIEGGREAPTVDLAKWVSWFSFDFMGDIAFGGTYNLMESNDAHGAWDIMEKSLIFTSIAQHIPWISLVTRFIPSLTKDAHDFARFAASQAKQRASSEPEQRDLFYHLIQSTKDEANPSPLRLIMSNTVLAIVAGSDTVATGLSNVFYFLLTHRGWLERVKAEVDLASLYLPSTSVPSFEKLAQLKALNAVINEALRLYPPLPSSIQRAPAAGSGGRNVGPIFVPEGTGIQIPPYSMHRNPLYFSPGPDEFRPERWLSEKNETALDRAAFIPFSMGPANCVGRHLAMDELRYIVSLLLRNFDLQLEPGYNPERWEEELKDRFVTVKGRLPVRLALRQDY